ncbi:minichromosome maintenance 10 [Wolffia australiana]
MAGNGEEDLELLLSLKDRVLETPPGSPFQPSGYESEDESQSRPRGSADMSIFRRAVEDCMAAEPARPAASVSWESKPDKSLKNGGVVIEKYSGLRIRNLVLSEIELNNHFADVRFINLAAIRNSMVGDKIAGHWATVGVLTERGHPKLSSSGKNFSVWKMGCLNESVLSVFLFGDAFQQYPGEPVGTVFAVFNSSVRKDGTGISLSVFSAGQFLKLGTSVDYGVCGGKRKDGMPCTMVINKRQGVYCKYHMQNASQRYSTARAELKGGNLRSTFRPLSVRGIHMVDPSKGNSLMSKSSKPAQVLSVDGLKRVLSKAGKMTTKSNSQGLRFLSELTAQPDSKKPCLLSSNLKPQHPSRVHTKRSTPGVHMPEEKKQKLIELEVLSSDEEDRN